MRQIFTLSKSIMAVIVFSMMLSQMTEAKFRDSREDLWYTERPLWANYTEVNRTHESIKIAWEPVQNSGFHYVTQVERCMRNETHLRQSKHAIYPSGNHMNHTYFYTNFVLDEYWQDCEYTIHGMVREQIF